MKIICNVITIVISAKDEKRHEDDWKQSFHRAKSRQMARFDKNYILGLQTNGKMTEDLLWISGEFSNLVREISLPKKV